MYLLPVSADSTAPWPRHEAAPALPGPGGHLQLGPGHLPLPGWLGAAAGRQVRVAAQFRETQYSGKAANCTFSLLKLSLTGEFEDLC